MEFHISSVFVSFFLIIFCFKGMMKNRGRSPSATATHGRLEANISSRGGHSPHSSEAGDLPHSPRDGLSVRDSHTPRESHISRDSHTPRESHTSRDSHTPRESHTHSREPSSVNSSLAVDEGGIQYSPSHSGIVGWWDSWIVG